MEDSDIVSTLLPKDLNKFIRIRSESQQWENLNEEIIENDELDNYTDIENYIIFLNEVDCNFSQEEINKLETEMAVIFYFYVKELFCLDFINTNFKDNKKERILYKKFSNSLLRLLFENNNSIKEIAANINNKLNNINQNYLNFELNMDLSEKTYLKKIKDVFKTEDLPHFLLVRGYRLLKNLRKEKENYENNLKLYNNDDSIKINKNESNNDDKRNDINFLDIISQFYSNKSTPFCEKYDISLNPDLLYLFLIFYQQYKKEDIKNLKKKIFDKLTNIFLLNYYEENIYNNLINEINNQEKEKIINKIIESFFSDECCNSKEYLIKFIMASYCYLIFEIGFENPKKLFQEFISSLENYFEIIYDVKICLTEFDEKIKYNLDYYTYFKANPTTNTTSNPIENPTTNIISNPKELLTLTLNDIEIKMNKCVENSLKERFYNNISDEKNLELEQNKRRSKRRIVKIVNWLKKKFDMSQKKDEIIEKKLKLIPHSSKVKGDMITIFITGFYSSDSDLKDYWKNFTNEYLNKYPNSMIYYYNWPSNSMDFYEIVYNKEEFDFADERAQICGKLLANIIESNLFFGNFKINLVGFSLGSHIIKNCLEEIFIAGATSYELENWDNIFGTVKGKIFNCYSKCDVGLIIRALYLFDTSIGRNELKKENSKVMNLNCTPCVHLLYRTKLRKIAQLFMDYFFDK